MRFAETAANLPSSSNAASPSPAHNPTFVISNKFLRTPTDASPDPHPYTPPRYHTALSVDFR
jgi:hypothetical protein